MTRRVASTQSTPNRSSNDVRPLHEHRGRGRTQRPFPRLDTHDQGTRRYNIAPTEQVLAVVAAYGEPEARLLRWGLIPPWAKDLKRGAKLMNARGDGGAALAVPRADPEGVAAGAAGRGWLFRVVGAGAAARGEPRQPFYFQVDGGETFAFAALWTPAKVAGEWINSVTLLTCEASSPVGGDPRPQAGDPRRRGCAACEV